MLRYNQNRKMIDVTYLKIHYLLFVYICTTSNSCQNEIDWCCGLILLANLGGGEKGVKCPAERMQDFM